MSKIRKFLTYPVVIDWLQWGEFPEKLGDIDCPQITLSLIKEYREHIDDLQAQLAEKDKRIEKLEAALEQIEKEGIVICSPMARAALAEDEV